MNSFRFFLKNLFIYFYRGEGKEKERERNINVWLPLADPLLGTWLATQACALTGNQTNDPLVRRPVLNPLSHTSQSITKPLLYEMLKGSKKKKIKTMNIKTTTNSQLPKLNLKE